MSLQICALGVADGDGGVSMSEKIADRSTNYVTSAHDDGILALEVDSRLSQQDHDTLGSAWGEERMAGPLCELTDVFRAEAIDIFLGNDCRGDGILRYMIWDRKLDQDSMDGSVIVQLVDLLKELCLRDVGRQMDEFT